MKRIKYIFSLLVILAQIFIAPISVFAESLGEGSVPSVSQDVPQPDGPRTFYNVEAHSPGKWDDGVEFGPTLSEVRSNGNIYKIIKNQPGYYASKFKTREQNYIAFCLNWSQVTPSGVGYPVDNLTPEQITQLRNLLRIGYVEQGNRRYRGEAVKHLSNIDAFLATMWAVHKIVPTEDISILQLWNPDVDKAANTLVEWSKQDLSPQLNVTRDTEKRDGFFVKEFNYTAPHSDSEINDGYNQGNADISLDKDIPGAQIIIDGASYDIGLSTPHNIPLNKTFEIRIPDNTPTNKIIIDAKGGRTSFAFRKYSRPQPNQQESLVVGESYVSSDERNSDMNWINETPEIKTNATNAKDNTKVLPAEEKAQIKDVVDYKNLIPGKEYELKGKLMDKATNQPLVVGGKEVTASKTFTPNKATGKEELVFEFNASALKGKKIVVFEDLYQDGKEVATHSDITDVNQTVDVKTNRTPVNPNNNNTPKNYPSSNSWYSKFLPKTGEKNQAVLWIAGVVILLILAAIGYKRSKKSSY